jgi:hypothetical protein
MNAPAAAAAADSPWLARIGAVLAVAMVANVAAAALAYLVFPGYIDHGEAAISAAAWRMLEGIPVYHSFSSADRTTNLYGPLNFLWHAWAPALFGGTLIASKLAAALSALMIPALLWPRLRSWEMGSWALVLGCALILGHLAFPVVIRPDALLTALVAAGVLAVAWGERGGGFRASLLLGLLAGLAVNLKLHGPIYLAPLAVLHLAGDWRRLGPMALAAVVVAVLPFASPLFPPADYLSWFGGMAGKENTLHGLRGVGWQFQIYLLLPPLLFALAGREGWARVGAGLWLYLGCYLAAMVLVLFPATKIGAGSHYYLPFMPLMLDLCLRASRIGGRSGRQRIVFLVAVGVTLAAAIQPERRFFKKLDWEEAAVVTAEIESILAEHPGRTLQMGVGGNPSGDALTFRFYGWRNLPVLRGHPYTLDSGIVMELTKLGVPLPAETIRRIETCHTDLWLVPTGEEPFSLRGYYGQTVYDKSFRAAFAAHHVKIASYRIFDLWECRK